MRLPSNRCTLKDSHRQTAVYGAVHVNSLDVVEC